MGRGDGALRAMWGGLGGEGSGGDLNLRDVMESITIILLPCNTLNGHHNGEGKNTGVVACSWYLCWVARCSRWGGGYYYYKTGDEELLISALITIL